METVDPKILAIALPVAYFVGIGVDIAKQAVGDDERRVWALPLIGVLLGVIFAAASQAFQGVPMDAQTMSGSLLAGFLAYGLAAASTAVHKTVRASTRQERVRKVREAGSLREAA